MFINRNFSSFISSASNRRSTDAFIKKYHDKLDWTAMSKHQVLSEEIIRQFPEKIEWYHTLKRQVLSDDLLYDCCTKYLNVIQESIRRCKDIFYVEDFWTLICKHQPLKEPFIRTFIGNLKLYDILKYNKVSDDFIIKHAHKFGISEWISVCMYQVLNEKIIRRYSKKVYWNLIFNYQHRNITESFIRENLKHISDFDWYELAKYCPLSESFIDDFAYELRWSRIVRYQVLSENFIRKNISYIRDAGEMQELFMHQTLSLSFIEEIEDEVGWRAWLNISMEPINVIGEFKLGNLKD